MFDRKKLQLIKEAINSFLQTGRVLAVSFGEAKVVELEVVNPYDHDQAFSITTEDPEAKHLSKPEFSLVDNASEWKFWVDKGGFPRPPEWNMIKDGVVLLRPYERVTLLFKFLSFREFASPEHIQQAQKTGEQGSQSSTQYLKARKVDVFVNELNGKVIGGLGVSIEPHAQIIDHVFRFFEQENRQVTLNLPTLYQSSKPPAQRYLEC